MRDKNLPSDSNQKSGARFGFFKIKNSLREFTNRNREVLIVGLLALLVYLPAIWWGMPHATHPLGVHGWDLDAVTGLLTLSEMHNLLVQPKPDWYLAYPLFHYLIIGVSYLPYLTFLYLTGEVSQLSDQYPFGLRDPLTTLRHLTLIGRGITLSMAIGIVMSVYLTALTIWDKNTARLAALAVALPTPMVYYARVGNLDVPVLFWTSLTILMMARALKNGLTTRRALAVGALAALAVATKDQAYGALLVGMAMLVVVHLRQKDESAKIFQSWKAPLIMGFAGLFVYAAANGLFINPNRFFGHIWFIRNYDKTFFNVIHLDILRPQTLDGYAALTFDVFNELFISVGPILLLAGFIGAAFSWRASAFTKILAAMLIGYIILVIFPIRHMQFRYVLFPVLIFSFFIARAAVLGLRQRKWAAAAVFAVLIAGFGWVGLRAVDLTYQMVYDARYGAGCWFYQNVEPGDKVVFFTSQNILPNLPEGTVGIRLMNDPAASEKIAREQARFVIVQPDFSSEFDSDHSHFLPESIYHWLNDGSLGYTKAASFEAPQLFTGLFLDLPLVSPGYIVNPPVKIYELKPPTDDQGPV
jgi:hypothetical protein